MLRRTDLEHGIGQFYSLTIEWNSFETVRLLRRWGWIDAIQGAS